MKVRQLIADTIWTPGPAYGKRDVTISLVMPTFRRGADGSFLRAAESVLGQTQQNLELIIIDDASTDGTAAQIQQLMAKDDRISLLTHPRNVGLPAISVFEGYMKAHAQYIGFVFDDFVFEPNAFEKLLADAIQADAVMLHGWAKLAIDCSGECVHLGLKPEKYEILRRANFLPNAGVILRRDLVEEIGWLDPHICIARLCDWDYWERIRQRRAIDCSSAFVGTEYGASRNDSLGATYPLDVEAVIEFAGYDRNHLLTSDAYLDRDVWSCPAGASDRLKEFIKVSRRRLSSKHWARDLPIDGDYAAATHPDDNKRIVVMSCLGEASTSLYFDGIENPLRKAITYLQPSSYIDKDMECLAGATAVIVVRDLFAEPYWTTVSVCQKLQIPVYYMMDDNFFVLADSHSDYRIFANPAVPQHIRQCAGLILTSPALTDMAKDKRLNDKLYAVQPILDARLDEAPPPRTDHSLNVAFAGGSFRMDQLRDDVVPALDRLAGELPVKMIVRGGAAHLGNPRSVDVIDAPFYGSFAEFIQRWRKYRPNVLVHPRGNTPNADYKTANAIMVSYLLGTVPVVTDEAAYAGLGEAQGVMKVLKGDADDWYDALRRLTDVDYWNHMRDRLSTFCHREFATQCNEDVVRTIMARHPAADETLRQKRLDVLHTIHPPTIHMPSRMIEVLRRGVHAYAPQPVITTLRRVKRWMQDRSVAKRLAS